MKCLAQIVGVRMPKKWQCEKNGGFTWLGLVDFGLGMAVLGENGSGRGGDDDAPCAPCVTRGEGS